MKHKTLHVPIDCEGALQTAIRIRIIYLQSYREQIHSQWLKYAADNGLQATAEANALKRAEDAVMADIANLTMLGDRLNEALVE